MFVQILYNDDDLTSVIAALKEQGMEPLYGAITYPCAVKALKLINEEEDRVIIIIQTFDVDEAQLFLSTLKLNHEGIEGHRYAEAQPSGDQDQDNTVQGDLLDTTGETSGDPV